MGRLRGKRNRDQDRYWHIRRKATQGGMVSSSLEASALCTKCGGLTLREQLHRGWCLSCVAEWVDSTDPWLIYQAQSQLPQKVVPLSTMRRMEQLQDRITEPVRDEAFLPLTQFMGRAGVGHYKSMWNVLHALLTLELGTTAEVLRLGTVCPNTVHLCGKHAPIQRMSLQGFLSRIKSAGADFKLLRQDRVLNDYIRGFVSDNRMMLWTYKKTTVDVYGRLKTARFVAKFGKTHFDKHQPAHWPFEGEYDGKLREEGKLEELPDVVMEIGKLVEVRSMPETLREDLCQDLVVAVLTGEATLEELRIEGRMKWYVREAFKNHPLKYGRYSLDQPVNDFDDGMRQRIDLVTHDDTSPERAGRTWLSDLCVDPSEHARGWHDGHGRPKGLATVAQVARHNQGGHAIDGPSIVRTPEEIDEDIAEVFHSETNPRWRRRLSD